MGKTAIWIMALLVVAILIIVLLQYLSRQSQLRAAQQQALTEAQLLGQYFQYANAQEQLDAQNKTTFKDWLGVFGDLSSGAADIYSGYLGSGNGTGG